MAGRLAASLAVLRQPTTILLLFQIAFVGAALGLESDVFYWVHQLGNHHQVLLVHAAAGTVLTLFSANVIGRFSQAPLPNLLEAVWGFVEGALLTGAGAVLLAAWGHRSEAGIHDQVMPGLHAPAVLNSAKLAAAGFLVILAALPSWARSISPLLC